MSAQRPSFPRTVLRMSAGAIIWALHFGTVYWATTAACALGLGVVRVPWFSLSAVILGATGIALVAALAVVVSATWTNLGSVRNWMAAGIGAVAAVAIAWEGLLPVLLLPACV